MRWSCAWGALALLVVSVLVPGCGGGSGAPAPGPQGPGVAAFPLTVSVRSVKTFAFEWPAQPGATLYRLFEDVDGDQGSAPEALLAELPAGSTRHETALYLPARVQARYRVEACGPAGCMSSSPGAPGSLTEAIGYFKASHPAAWDEFGQAVALSADGSTLAVSAYLEGALGGGVDPAPARTGGSHVGAVYVFVRGSSGWVQQAYLKPFESDSGDEFGYSLALSGDGNRLVVGASGDDSAVNGFLGVPSDNSLSNSGIAYTYERNAVGQWRTGERLKGWHARVDDLVGYAVALSADGRTLALGAHTDDSDTGGIDPTPTFGGSANLSGAVYVFTHDGSSWRPQAYLKAEVPGFDDLFGSALALSANGDTLLVSAPQESGGVGGVDAAQTDNSARRAGAAYVFVRDGAGMWRQQAYLKPTVIRAGDRFGRAVQLSANGRTAVVSADQESGASSGVDGDPSVLGLSNAGAVHVFDTNAGAWAQTAYLKPPRARAGQLFGLSLALSADGQRLAVGAMDHGAAGGLHPEDTGGVVLDSGAAFLFSRGGSGPWAAAGLLKAPQPQAGAYLGWGTMAYSADGQSLAVGMSGDFSAATGIQGDPTDRSMPWSGAVLLY